MFAWEAFFRQIRQRKSVATADWKRGMENTDSFIAELVDLANFLEQQTGWKDSLHDVATMIAGLLNSENCLILLWLDGRGAQRNKPRSFFHQLARRDDGIYPSRSLLEKIARHVAATGDPVLIPDLALSSFASMARWRQGKNMGLASAPIFTGDRLFGAISITTPRDGRILEEKDLHRLTTAALILGRSIQVTELKNLLKSRFAQLALAQEGEALLAGAMIPSGQDSGKVAKVVAKTFYRELTKAGFGAEQIIDTATEIISLLNERLKKHSNRRKIHPENHTNPQD